MIRRVKASSVKATLATVVTIGACLSGHRASAQTPLPPAPKDFAVAAAQSDEYEILAGQIALVEGSDPRVRAFAQQMIRDHTRTSEDLRQAAIASGMPPPGPGLGGDQAALLSALQSLRGADFDRAYARQQMLAHTQASTAEARFATSGHDPNLRKAAQSALPMVLDHLRAAQRLLDELGDGS